MAQEQTREQNREVEPQQPEAEAWKDIAISPTTDPQDFMGEDPEEAIPSKTDDEE